MKRSQYVKTLEDLYAHKKIILFVLISFYAMGVLWHALPATFPLMLLLTPFVLLLFGLFIFGAALVEGGRRFFLWAVLTFVGTFILEAVGVATGAIFGEYAYGDVLGVKLFEVPLVIGFNWTIVVLGIAAWVGRFIGRRVLAILLTALGGVLFDWLMEPIAMELGYWNWAAGSIPLQNYVAWFLIGLGAATGYFVSNLRIRSIYPPVYVCIQALFFVALRFVVLA